MDLGEVDAKFLPLDQNNLNPGNATKNSTRQLPKGSPLRANYLKPTTNKPATQKPAAKKPAGKKAVAKKAVAKGYIGISGYPFRSKEAPYNSTICVFENAVRYVSRFKGSITIRFHQLNKPKSKAGVYRVGFYAGRLNHPEALRVSLYGLDGKLLCRQANIQDRQFAFMGFVSTKKISRIEIETIGLDEDYAISGLMFDEVGLAW